MESLLTSPALIDFIIIFTMIEGVVLILWRRRASAISRRERPAIGGGTAWLGRGRADAVARHLPAAGGAGGLGGSPVALGAHGTDRGARRPPAGSSVALAWLKRLWHNCHLLFTVSAWTWLTDLDGALPALQPSPRCPMRW